MRFEETVSGRAHGGAAAAAAVVVVVYGRDMGKQSGKK